MRIWPVILLGILFLWLRFSVSSVVMWIILAILLAVLGGLIVYMWANNLFLGPEVLKDHIVESSKRSFGISTDGSEEEDPDVVIASERSDSGSKE